MIKPVGPSRAASEPEPSLKESTLPAENQLALMSWRPNLRHLHCSAKRREKPLFIHWDIMAEKTYLQKRGTVSGRPLHPNQPFLPVHPKLQMGNTENVWAGRMFRGISAAADSTSVADH
ncbi:hypothetical protein PBY51_020104 [Eleginops maclovinus]|uniref:Uncharacterized protein n=1 Tax=Eleginops maclovinus TaxID=56733 RepID=A0AAN7XR97_ELEMC|nr:hypothetical protein PBY51_020104 [Eleginops maclovinus]